MPIELPLPESERERLRPVDVRDLIRVGRDHDGGYILPRRLVSEADSVLSLGISDDWSFEEQLQQLNPGLRIDGYDHTVGRKRFKRQVMLQSLRTLALRCSLRDVRESLSILRSYGRFFKAPNRHFPQRITNRPRGPGEIDVASALDRLNGKRVLVKMDIEGSEYRVIDHLASNAWRIVGLCIEFHDTEPFRTVFDRAVDTMLRDFALVHIHANNYGPVADDGLPDVLEMSFLHRSHLQECGLRQRIYLDKLDQPNNPSQAELVVTL